MWKQLLALLFGFYTFRIGPGDEGGEGGGEDGDNDGGGDGSGDDDEAGEDANDGEGGDEDDAGNGGDSRTANIKALRLKAQAEREARIALEARLQASEQSNRELAARIGGGGGGGQRDEGPPADADEQTKFVHGANKVLKSTTEKVDRATFIALDAADKVEFYSGAADDPNVLKYKARVEAELQRMVREEKNRAPRELILTYLIGLDARKASVAKAKNGGKKTVEQAAAEERTRAARSGGAPPRSDAKGGEKKTDRQKREQRLLDQPI